MEVIIDNRETIIKEYYDNKILNDENILNINLYLCIYIIIKSLHYYLYNLLIVLDR